jgi:hypothetical protein
VAAEVDGALFQLVRRSSLDRAIGRSPASASPESISRRFHFSNASGAAWPPVRDLIERTRHVLVLIATVLRLTGMFVFVR